MIPVRIVSLLGREVLDSRGNPTVQAELRTAKGAFAAIAPAGASKGAYEALELRDNDPSRFIGRGVLNAVANVNGVIAKAVSGKTFSDQRQFDDLLLRLDSSPNKAKLGANATIACSIAFAKAAAAEEGVPLHAHIAASFGAKPLLPIPAMNLINGGLHAGNDLALQEFLLFPIAFHSFADALRAGVEVYHSLKEIIAKRHGRAATAVGDEGGFAPPLAKTTQALELLEIAIGEAGYSRKVGLGLDCAASTFFRQSRYFLEGKSYDSAGLLDWYASLIKEFKLISIEDPFEQNDFGAFAAAMARLKKVQIVGDDLTVTSKARIERAIKAKAANCLLLKPNQIGTLSEALDAARAALEGGWAVMPSHRSADSEDNFIADLAVGLGCGQLKAGAPCRGERTAKYNRLLVIEEELGRSARFAKWRV